MFVKSFAVAPALKRWGRPSSFLVSPAVMKCSMHWFVIGAVHDRLCVTWKILRITTPGKSNRTSDGSRISRGGGAPTPEAVMFRKILYLETKEFGPRGDVPGARPLDLPMRTMHHTSVLLPRLINGIFTVYTMTLFPNIVENNFIITLLLLMLVLCTIEAFPLWKKNKVYCSSILAMANICTIQAWPKSEGSEGEW